ncbi:MAG: hypothetical protein ACK2UP_18770 [Candidatus Promineifilaceae bacterium]|jgi:hypothetical protein
MITLFGQHKAKAASLWADGNRLFARHIVLPRTLQKSPPGRNLLLIVNENQLYLRRFVVGFSRAIHIQQISINPLIPKEMD